MNYIATISLVLIIFSGCLHYPADIQRDTIFRVSSAREKPTLVNFAVESNDIYNTRTAKREVAEKIFDITESQFGEGFVEKLVDKKTNALIGFFSFKDSKENSSIELGHLFISPDLINQGYGRQLFARALAKAKSLGKKRVYWISDPDAEGFYLKMGARKIGTDENILNPKVRVPLFEIKI
ncbi:MAG: GNAT family N-acetyltransferase [Oligoflexales bacterium]